MGGPSESESLTVEPLLDPETVLAVGELQAKVIDDPWPPDAVAEVLSMPGAFGLIARDPSEAAEAPLGLIGYVICSRAGDDGEILSVGVRESHRRQGLGRRLLDSAVATLFSAGAEGVFLEVAESNAGAIGLYKHAGFEAVGRRRNYAKTRDGAREDALIMRRGRGDQPQTQP